MVTEENARADQVLGAPADQLAALFDRYKLVLIGLATVSVIVVAAQLVFLDPNALLVAQLVIALLLLFALLLRNFRVWEN